MTLDIPVLWLHGWSMSPGLNIFPDRPGPSGKDGLLTVSFDECRVPADFDRAVRIRIEAVPGVLDIAAWSLGGLLALRAAAELPLKVRRLVLMAATPKFTADPVSGWRAGWPLRVLKRMQRRLAANRQGVLRDFREAMFTEAECRVGWPDRLPEDPPHAGSWSDQALAAGLDYLAAADLRQRVGEIKAPALVIHGARDVICPVAGGRWLAERLPRAEWLEIEEAGHAPFLTQPERVWPICREFLE